VIALLPELVLKSDEPLLEALQARQESTMPDEAEDLLLLVVQGRALFRRCWERTRAKLRAGVSDQSAQLMLDVMVKLANGRARIIALVLKAAGEADASRRAEGGEALAEAREIEASARELLRQSQALHQGTKQIPASFDAERARRSLEQAERGEGVSAEELLTNLTNP
jgi:hypothetical protein